MLSTTECCPKRIIQIVSGSRSGSSLLKKVLGTSPDIMCLAGEEEPYFAMSGNGYGLNQSSDQFSTLVNQPLFKRLLQTELTTEDPWEWRLRMQFTGGILAKLLNELPKLNPADPVPWLRQQEVYGYYDGCAKAERLAFTQMVYEMPPYVLPQQHIEPKDTLLLKAPYNLFRFGLLEQVFPNTQFSYIFLTRNPAATINGLIDGWEAPYGFHKHLIPTVGWWKFEMPTGWEKTYTANFSVKSRFQWEAASRLQLDPWGKVAGVRLRFEDLITDPEITIKTICQRLEITSPRFTELPVTMATETPQPFRWKKRAELILHLLSPYQDLIAELGYKDQTKWL